MVDPSCQNTKFSFTELSDYRATQKHSGKREMERVEDGWREEEGARGEEGWFERNVITQSCSLG